MNKSIVNYIFFSILLIIFLYGAKVYLTSKNRDLVWVKSSIDGMVYKVQNRPDKLEAANMLAKIRAKLMKLSVFLYKKYPNDKSSIRVIQKYMPDSIYESDINSKQTSFSVNKGEKVIFCIRSKNKENRLEDENTLMFVALHELAHIMSTGWGHKTEFWQNFKFILKNSIEAGVYKYQNFKANPVKYCGVDITRTPYEI